MSTRVNPLAAPGRLLIAGIDGILRRHLGVGPFTEDPSCILRIAYERSRQELLLSDATQVRPGDLLLGLHAWNERLRERQSEEENFAWGRYLLRGFADSLRLLAHHLASTNPGSLRVVAMRGEFSFVMDLQQAARIARRLGFDLILLGKPGSRIWRKPFWDNFYACMLMWAYNPPSLRGKRLFDLNRVQIWISRSRLLELYGYNSIPLAKRRGPFPQTHE